MLMWILPVVRVVQTFLRLRWPAIESQDNGPFNNSSAAVIPAKLCQQEQLELLGDDDSGLLREIVDRRAFPFPPPPPPLLLIVIPGSVSASTGTFAGV